MQEYIIIVNLERNLYQHCTISAYACWRKGIEGSDGEKEIQCDEKQDI